MSSDRAVAPLGELLEALIDHRGRTPKKLGADFVSTGVRVISAKNVRNGRLDLSFEPRFVSEEVYERWMPNRLEAGDVLLTSEAPMGEAAYLRDGARYCLGQRLFALRADVSRLDGRFLYYALRSPSVQARLRGRLSGTTAEGIRQTELVRVEVPLPPIDEQERIAGVLGALDDKIEHNRSFGLRLQATARLRVLSACKGANDSASIYDVASVTYGAAYKSALFGDKGVPLLRIRDLATHAPEIRTAEFLPKSRTVTRSDIVVGMDGEFRAHLWHGSEALLNQRLCVFDPLEGISRAFVWEALRESLAYIEATEAGTTVIHLGKADIDDFRVPKLSRDAMERLVAETDPLVDLSTRLLSECRRLSAIGDALLPKLVSGQIRVSERDAS